MPDESAPPIEEESFTPPSGKGPGGGSSPATSQPTAAGEFATTDDDEQKCPGLHAWIAEANRLRDALASSDARVSELASQNAALATQLSQSREALDHAEKRHQIDALLTEADTIDIESTRLLTELAVQQMPGKEVREVIADLRRRKPMLFRAKRTSTSAPGPMSPTSRTAPGEADLEDAAEEAALTGDRNALLRYLRARRGA